MGVLCGGGLQRDLGCCHGSGTEPCVRPHGYARAELSIALAVYRHDGGGLCHWLLAHRERPSAVWRIRLDRVLGKALWADWFFDERFKRGTALEFWLDQCRK